MHSALINIFGRVLCVWIEVVGLDGPVWGLVRVAHQSLPDDDVACCRWLGCEGSLAVSSPVVCILKVAQCHRIQLALHTENERARRSDVGGWKNLYCNVKAKGHRTRAIALANTTSGLIFPEDPVVAYFLEIFVCQWPRSDCKLYVRTLRILLSPEPLKLLKFECVGFCHLFLQ